MSRDWGTYRKLFENPAPAFERLPFLARAVAARLLIHCDRNGRIIPSRDDGDASDVTLSLLATDLCFHVRAHPAEEPAIREALVVLLSDGYLCLADGYLMIRNFAEAQRSDSADRMAKKRARDAAKRDESDVTDVTTVSSSRIVSSSGSSSSEGVQGEDDPAKVKCPPDLRPGEDELAALEVSPGIPRWAVDAMAGPLVAAFQTANPRPLSAWRRTLVKALCSQWSDPSKRPKPPPTPTKADLAARAARDRLDAEERARRGGPEVAPVRGQAEAARAVLQGAAAALGGGG